MALIKFSIIKSIGLPSIGKKAKPTPRRTNNPESGILTIAIRGKTKVIQAATTPTARYANCFTVMSPMSLN